MFGGARTTAYLSYTMGDESLGTDGAASDNLKRNESKRVDPKALADIETGQRGHHKRTTDHTPRRPRPSHNISDSDNIPSTSTHHVFVEDDLPRMLP